jgi:hypothetical protein
MMPGGHHSAHEIYRKLREVLGKRFEYEEILNALKRLSSSGQIRATTQRFEDPDNEFDIPIDKRNELRDMAKQEENLERRVLTVWKTYLISKHRSILPETLNQMVVDVKICSYRILSKHSAEVLELYYGNNEKLNSVLRTVNELDYCEKSDLIPPDFEQIRRKEVLDFFLQADETRKRYIASLLHSLFLLYLTQFDSNCAIVLRSELKPGKIYLDTNFIFALVGLSGADMLLASQRLADFTIKLGFQIVISPRTQSEYEHSLKIFLADAKLKPLTSPELASLALDATNDDDIYTTYWKQVAESKGSVVNVDPQVFYDYYINLASILEQYQVKIDDTFHDEIIVQDSEIASEASRLRSVMEDVFGPQAVDDVSQHVLDHDVYHRFMILKYRKGLKNESFLDARAWFLTCDTKLPLYDRVVRGADKSKLPFCVLSGQWLQLIRPYIGENMEFDVAQIQMIVSPLLRAYPKPPTRLINSVVTNLGMSTKFIPKAVSKMLGNRHFMEQFQAVITDVARQDLIDSFYAAYAEETEKELRDKNRHVEELSKIIADKDQEKQALSIKYAQEIVEQKNRVEEITENAKQQISEVKNQLQESFDGKYNQLVEKVNKEQSIQRWVIVLLGWMVYLGFRRPWVVSSNYILEIVTSILIASLIGSLLNKKSRSLAIIIGIIIGVTVILFCISLFASSKVSNAILYVAAGFGGLGGAYQFIEPIIKKIQESNKIVKH